ncbi:MAG TPA: hypothetical protein VK922_07525 [Gemmatimonadaceae bacterium]|nr:hypothetical protein [Gemmatimonadaceae bacterium]
MSRRLTAVGALVALSQACAPTDPPERAQPARYLFAWAYDLDGREGDTDFLAVIDADSSSPTYATVVATVPSGKVKGMPHHTEQVMPPNGVPLFANTFHTGRSVLVDLTDPLAPRIAGEAEPVPGYRMPHSYYRLSDGRVLVTLQYGNDSIQGKPGGLALFSAAGKFIRSASAADAAFPGAAIRTYSGDVAEAADRVLTTSSPMDSERTADVMQLWRLSDLTLLRTIALPETATDTMWHYPFEVRFLAGGDEAFMNTFYCAFYHLTGLDGDAPRIQRVHALDFPRSNACGVPLLIGHWWIMPVESAREILVFDISDPGRPRQVQALATDSTFSPHWSSRDPRSDRLVFPTEAHGDARILVARFDSVTGRLAWDESFREPGSTRLGVSLRRDSWPHGDTGPAAPHGVVFGPVN